MSRRKPRLITELLALANTWGWTVADLARELDLDATTILHYRSGRRDLTKRTLAKIAARFGEHRMVRDLIWHHLIEESGPAAGSTRARRAVPHGLDPAIEQALRAYADRFAEESVHAGRGLFIVADAAATLTAAAQFTKGLFEAAKVPVCALRADKTPNAVESRFALAAPLLLLERVDFASPAVNDLLRRRADLVRPTVVTSMQPPDSVTDVYLRRVCTSAMRRVESQTIAPVSPARPPSSPRVHAT
jgi:transcriptional regulator with XRE-family HTH domain